MKENQSRVLKLFVLGILTITPASLNSCNGVLNGTASQDEAIKKTGTLSGIIKDAKTSKPIEGAEVKIDNNTVKTDSEGFYSIDRIILGSAVIRVSKEGYENLSSDVVIKGKDTKNLLLNQLSEANKTPDPVPTSLSTRRPGLIIDSTLVVTTIAGSTQGFADGTGTNAKIWDPAGLTVDSSGNIYVSDWGNRKIRKISPEGVVSTLAGSTYGSADGTGTNAKFTNPRGIAVDSSGHVFVTDWGNEKIRKISPEGVVSTLAGSGAIGFEDGTASNAKFNHPEGVTVDSSGYVYIAEMYNNRIRKISPEGIVSTLAGSSAGFEDGTAAIAKFNVPEGVAVDTSGNVYVADTGNDKIRKIKMQKIINMN